MSEKKRKRTEDASPSKKQKKAAVQQPSSSRSVAHNIRVSSLVKPKLSPPVIATTPGLCLPQSIQFETYSKLQNAKGKPRDARPVLQDLLLHSSSHKSIEYTGREDRSQGEGGFLRHYIGVFDPKTGKLEVVEARRVIVRGSVRSQQASAEAMEELTEKQTTLDLKTDLGHTFGTKKAKKALDAKAENAIKSRRTGDSDAPPQHYDDGEAALMESIQEVTATMATAEQLQAAAAGAKPVPRGHYDAAEIQDVYDPEDIIGPDVLNAIPVRDWQQAIRDGQAIQVHSQYVANRVRRVGAHDESLKRLRIMRYLYLLILFWIKAKPGRQGSKKLLPREKLKNELPTAPDMVIDSLRKKFSDQGEMRKLHIDLLMTTCCVLASILDSFEVDTFDLREDLRLEQKQINQYFHEIGARTRPIKNGTKSITIAKLSLPLEFPKMRRMRR